MLSLYCPEGVRQATKSKLRHLASGMKTNARPPEYTDNNHNNTYNEYTWIDNMVKVLETHVIQLKGM